MFDLTVLLLLAFIAVCVLMLLKEKKKCTCAERPDTVAEESSIKSIDELEAYFSLAPMDVFTDDDSVLEDLTYELSEYCQIARLNHKTMIAIVWKDIKGDLRFASFLLESGASDMLETIRTNKVTGIKITEPPRIR